MTYGVVLLAAVGTGLVAHLTAVAVLHRRFADVTLTVALVLAAYWTIAGAVEILADKLTDPTSRASYLEDRLFPIAPDGTYAVALLAYVAFLLGVVGVVLALGRRPPAEGQVERWRSVAERLDHRRAQVVVAGLVVAKLAVLAWLARGHPLGELYEAVRTAHGDRTVTLYQYLNVATSYPAFAGAALWLAGSAPAARRRADGAAWAVLLTLLVGENAVLGNRAVPLVGLVALGVGWARWRFVPAPRVDRRRMLLGAAGAAAAGLLLVGLIGAFRSGGGPALSRAAAGAGNVVSSSEMVAAHMSLVGVIDTAPPLRPFASNSYDRYAAVVGAPTDQVFTVHLVAAWWLRVGPWLGTAAAIATFGLLAAALQRLGRRAPSGRAAPLVVAAVTLGAAGLPVTLLRSGPEAVRAVVVELVVIPGLVLAAGWRRDEGVVA